jgi:hypothetical protein
MPIERNQKMNQFDIGTFVIIHTITKKSRVSGGPPFRTSIRWEDFEQTPPLLGRVVGLCRKFEGELGIPLNYEEQAYLTVTGSTELYLVRQGWLNKPLHVRAENMRLATTDEIKDFPKLHMRQTCWNEQSRDDMRKEMVTWPRDKNGRWI